MRVSLSTQNGFGDQIVTTNAIESVNAYIKRWNSFTKNDIPEFLEGMKDLIDKQNDDVCKAWLNRQGM